MRQLTSLRPAQWKLVLLRMTRGIAPPTIGFHPMPVRRQLTRRSQPPATWSGNSRPVQQIVQAQHFVRQEARQMAGRPSAERVFAPQALPQNQTAAQVWNWIAREEVPAEVAAASGASPAMAADRPVSQGA